MGATSLVNVTDERPDAVEAPPPDWATPATVTKKRLQIATPTPTQNLATNDSFAIANARPQIAT
jgi:hypothetical protein